MRNVSDVDGWVDIYFRSLQSLQTEFSLEVFRGGNFGLSGAVPAPADISASISLMQSAAQTRNVFQSKWNCHFDNEL